MNHLTPLTIRTDKKCGSSGIADTKKCRKGVLGAALGRHRDARRTMERRYGKPKPLTAKQKLRVAGITALAAGVGVGAAALASRARNGKAKPSYNIKNIKVPEPGQVNAKGKAQQLNKAADRGRLNELESLARGNNPALEAQMQVNKARVKQELTKTKSELQMLRTELGVWGPNRIKPFKRQKRDSIWAEGFEPWP